MINWCAYCQKFLGEKPPYEVKSFSHGMCAECAAIGFDMSDAQEQKMQYLVDLNKRFWVASETENKELIAQLLDESIAKGLRPIDILFGFAAPMLYEVGVLWEEKKSIIKRSSFLRALVKV